MTDNSTQQAETTTTENAPVMTVQEMRRLKVRIERLKLSWDEEHNKEFRRLTAYFSNRISQIQKIPLPPTQENSARARAFLDVWTPSFPQDWIATPAGENISDIPINIISAFRKEYALVLEDRGAQMSLFDSPQPRKLTKRQEQIWANYYDLNPDARRMWLLATGYFLDSVLKYINGELEKQPSRQGGIHSKAQGSDSALLAQTQKTGVGALYTGTPTDALSVYLPFRDKLPEPMRRNIKQETIYKLEKPKADITFSPEKMIADIASGGMTALKLFHVALLILTQKNAHGDTNNIDREASFTLTEFLDLCGKPTTKTNLDWERPIVKKAINHLYSLSCDWTTPSGRSFARVRYFPEVALRRGKITMRFSEGMATYLVSAFVSHYPIALLRINNNNPHAYVLGCELWKRYGIDKNWKNGTHDIISVQSILELYKGLADINKIKATDRAATRRIIEPIERDLDLLVKIGVLESWEWCGEKKRPLNKQGLEQTYEALKGAYIKFVPKDFPDQSVRRERKAKEEERKRKDAERKRRTRAAAKANKINIEEEK